MVSHLASVRAHNRVYDQFYRSLDYLTVLRVKLRKAALAMTASRQSSR
jgi:hypothetical protein